MKLEQCWRSVWILCFLGTGAVLFAPQVISAPATANISGADSASVFGIAHVDGKYYLTAEDFLNEGADQVLATGSKVIKLYLTPQRYPWNSDWPKHFNSLAEVAQAPYFKSVFSKPF